MLFSVFLVLSVLSTLSGKLAGAEFFSVSKFGREYTVAHSDDLMPVPDSGFSNIGLFYGSGGGLYAHINTKVSPDHLFISSPLLNHIVRCDTNCEFDGQIVYYIGGTFFPWLFNDECCERTPIILNN